VVLMIIAWTSLLHAIFRRRHVKPFYRRPGSQRYQKVEGEYKRWELSECLQQYFKDQNPPLRKNIEFFIAIRNRIEHCTLAQLDPEIFGECQAMLMNFERMLCDNFGDRYALKSGLSFALQFTRAPSTGQANGGGQVQARTFRHVKDFIDSFRSSLSNDVQSDLQYAFKVFLVPKVGSHATRDAVAVEWVKYDPTKPEDMKSYERIVAMIKTRQVPVANLGLLKPTRVVEQVRQRLGKPFTVFDHRSCYLHFNARPARGASDPTACDTRYCLYDDVHEDYCYKPEWVQFLVEKLAEEQTYLMIIQKKKASMFKAAAKQGDAA
jgi:hypothetical protein